MRWDEEKIRIGFPPYGNYLILSLPLSVGRPVDHPMWFDSKGGDYTVRLGYRLLCSEIEGFNGASTSIHMLSIWRKLWSLRIHRKINMFAWRMINGCLPTRAALIQRRLNVDSGCTFCDEGLKTDFHIFRNCPFAKAVWIATEWGFRDIAGHFSSAIDLLKDLLQQMGKNELEEIICVPWSLWKARNCFDF
ncbi:uncharacterized protein LOC110412305 [Herrania umbratica]|uniref:Uncharacterized protein LOC110412305 n=1 Tax=Herrania umbratica TaxID=108875 RepID=A0A6J0ZUY4_9ROSI|nr:uncharacterized protein LOC110412305 [Herrania umbratica]